MNRQCSKRNKSIVRKPVLIKSSLHRQLKLIAFNHDVKMQDLMDAIVETALDDKAGINRILNKLNVKNSS